LLNYSTVHENFTPLERNQQ